MSISFDREDSTAAPTGKPVGATYPTIRIPTMERSSIMARTKRNAFTVLGWLVWKILSLVGLPIAKKKLEERRTGTTKGRGRLRR